LLLSAMTGIVVAAFLSYRSLARPSPPIERARPEMRQELAPEATGATSVRDEPRAEPSTVPVVAVSDLPRAVAPQASAPSRSAGTTSPPRLAEGDSLSEELEAMSRAQGASKAGDYAGVL